MLVTTPSVEVGVTGPQLSVAVAVPNAASIVAEEGLQAVMLPFAGVPVVVITGAVRSNVHVAVRNAVEVLPQPSVAVHVLVCERWQPVLVTTPSVEVGVTGPQLSVAVAVPKAASIVAEEGLQVVMLPFAGVPVAVITGAVTSNVQVAVRDAVEVFPQASVAVHVLV